MSLFVTSEDEQLVIAAKNGDVDTVKSLILEQANVNWSKSNENGETALFVASQKGYVEVVKLLIEAGAEVDKETE